MILFQVTDDDVKRVAAEMELDPKAITEEDLERIERALGHSSVIHAADDVIFAVLEHKLYEV